MLDNPPQNSADILNTTAHRPYALPTRPWRLRQTWHDLLFCHWPISAATLALRLPPGLEPDTYDGSAWLGVIPFWMSGVRTRTVGRSTLSIPTTTTFPELNLRTYVRSTVSGLRGVYFFSLDCASPLAVFGARTLFHLPYFPAAMARTPLANGQTHYTSRRQLAPRPADYEATYGRVPNAEPLLPSTPGTLQHFLTERYCLFTPFLGRMLVGHIHHLPWPLEPAQADIPRNTIPASHGFTLPPTEPILHFSRSLEVFLWSLEPDKPR